jgi:hypothetical protein
MGCNARQIHGLKARPFHKSHTVEFRSIRFVKHILDGGQRWGGEDGAREPHRQRRNPATNLHDWPPKEKPGLHRQVGLAC